MVVASWPMGFHDHLKDLLMCFGVCFSWHRDFLVPRILLFGNNLGLNVAEARVA